VIFIWICLLCQLRAMSEAKAPLLATAFYAELKNEIALVIEGEPDIVANLCM
jgi:hypothetical protein